MQEKLPRQLQVFLAFVAASIVAAFGPLRHLASFAYHTGDQSYILLVPMLSAMLIYRDQDAIFADSRQGASTGALAFGGAGLLAIVAAYVVASGSELQMILCAIGLIACWTGAFIFSFGRRAARRSAFAFGMLLWIVPIPAVCIDAATRFLQVGSTELVAVLFQVTGTPVLRDGFVFQLATQSIEVAKECSGIRSSLCLILLTLIIAHETLRGNVRRALLVAATIPIVILKNGIRIVTLTLLAVHVDPSFLTGSLHRDGGIVFFLIGMVMLVPLISVLRRGDKPASQPLSKAAVAK